MDFNAKVAKSFAKVAGIFFAFLCESLCALCVKVIDGPCRKLKFYTGSELLAIDSRPLLAINKPRKGSALRLLRMRVKSKASLVIVGVHAQHV